VGVLLKLAFRNLKQHKSKSLIIGSIITLAVIVLIVGNSLMDTADRGIEKAFVENFTGQIMIAGQSRGKMSLFGVQSPGGIEETPVIPEFERVLEYVEQYPGIEFYTTQISGASAIKVEGQPDDQKRSFSFLIGIDPVTYPKMFPAATIVDGRYLEPGEEGLIISSDNLETLEERLEVTIGVGDPLLLTGFGNRGIKIREVPIVGVFEFEESTDGMEMISYIDAQTLRALKGMTTGNMGDIELSEQDALYLDIADSDSESISIDDLFSEDSLGFGEAESDSEEEDLLSSNLFTILTNADEEEDENAVNTVKQDTGSWEYIIATMQNKRRVDNFIDDINLWFEQEGINAQVGNWKAAAGPFATSADVVRIVFNIVVLLVVFVAVLIVINTLVISVIERTGEIGTMRALGAQKLFVRRLFNLEISSIVFTFGSLGILLALLILGIVTWIQIPANNAMLKILFAGDVLVPVIKPMNLLVTFGSLFVVGLAANIYPLSVALKVQPIEAMREN